jgi:hypothetical protein
LTSGGAPVAIHLIGGAGSTLAPSDEILFYGTAPTGRFAPVNVYWLTWGGSPGPVMSEVGATPSGGGAVPDSFPWTSRLEQQQRYTQNPPATALDYWWWDRLDNPAPASQPPPAMPMSSVSYMFDLPGLSSTAHDVDLRVSLQGRYDDEGVAPDHHTLVNLNSGLIDDQTWDGYGSFMHEMTLPSSSFSESGNDVTIELPGDTGADGDSLYTNFVEADYRRAYVAQNDRLEFLAESAGTFEFHVNGFSSTDLEVFDITDPLLPDRLTGFTFNGAGPFTANVEQAPGGPARYVAVERSQLLAPTAVELSQSVDLLDTANDARHLIITPEAFVTALEPLRDHHRASGSAEIVTTEDIFNVFNEGLVDPQAIVDFLTYAFASWTGQPSYVVLAGDGSIDYLNYMGNGPNSFVPTFLADIQPDFGETPCDNCYAQVSGGDSFPDMYVGRLPLSSVSEAEAVVDKLLAHENAPDFVSLNGQTLLIADDDSGDWPLVLNGLIANCLDPAMVPVQTVYLSGASDGSAENAAIMNALDAGSLWSVYLGLASVDQWAAETLLTSTQAATLTNSDRLSFVVAMYGFSGYFAHAELVAVVEQMVRDADGGAVAGWATDAITGTLDYNAILTRLCQSLFVDLEPAMGVASVDALVAAIAANEADPVNVEQLVFIGDPALTFAVDLDADQVAEGRDNCPGLANPTQDDFDADTLGDPCDPDIDDDTRLNEDDCDDFDAATWTAAAAVTDLELAPGAEMTWTLQDAGDSLVYDVVVGSIDDLRSDGDISQAACLTGVATPWDPYTDVAPPLPGGSYYLVRARNPCASDNDYGTSSVPAPRTSTACP